MRPITDGIFPESWLPCNDLKKIKTKLLVSETNIMDREEKKRD